MIERVTSAAEILTYVPLDLMERVAYDGVRAYIGRPLSDDRCAREGYCASATPPVTRLLSNTFTENTVGSERHYRRGLHWLTSLPMETGDEMDDIVADATYCQFLIGRGKGFPNFFLGTRGEMIETIERYAPADLVDQVRRLYMAETLSPPVASQPR